MQVSTVPVSVAIPCFGHEESLVVVMERVFACDPLPQEILLHFDGGWQPQRDLSAGAPIPIRVYSSPTNLGPGGGRDLLFKNAACDLVCSFDDDSWPLDRDFFARALALMNAFPNAALLSPAVYLREKPEQPALAEVSESVSFEGSASITRRSHYLTLPGYVPVPDAYGVEEVDLSLQAHAAGYQVLSSPWLRAWHDRPYADFQHGLVPWVKNEVLLAYLRYPRWFQPWGWLRAARHVLHHYSPNRLGVLLRAVGGAPAHCTEYERYVRRYAFATIWKHHFAPHQRWTITRDDSGIEVHEAPNRGVVMYLQYTNPAAYPPLEHSAMLLATRGWQVRFAGVRGRGEAQLEFPPFPRISVRRMNWCAPGFRQKLHYLVFALWCVWKALRFKPQWVYCSEPLSTLPGMILRLLAGSRIIYHEHDSPAPPSPQDKWFTRFSYRQRHRIAETASAIVLPNQSRLDAFLSENPTSGRAFCIWNCPSGYDLADRGAKRARSGSLRVLYHGSIVPERFPLQMLQVLAECQRPVTLRLIGYEVPGMIGYTDQLQAEAERLGVADRFEYLGTLPQRSDLMARAAECDVGLSLLQYRSADINMRHMAGASNKPFDYLSQGLALIVPREPEWERLFVQTGCAKACEPGNKDELVALLQWMADHLDEVRAMGATGRELIRTRWNYESQFQPLLELIEGETK